MRPLPCQVVAVLSACLFAARSVELPSTLGSSVETVINSGSWVEGLACCPCRETVYAGFILIFYYYVLYSMLRYSELCM